jgi:hypothetical protein
MSHTITDLIISTQFSASEITQLAQGLGAAGMNLGEFSEETQTAMLHMAHTFGMSADQMGVVIKSTEMFGSSLHQTLGDALAFQAGFGVPGVFASLPEIVTGARDMVLEFGEDVVGSGADVTRATMSMAGSFVKTFGVTMKEAVGKAQAALQKFAGAARTDRKVFLGLSDDFSGLTKTLFQMNMPFQDALDLTKGLASKDNLESIKALSDKLSTMGPPGSLPYERFKEMLRDEVTPEVFALIDDTNKLNEALADKRGMEELQQSIAGEGIESFNALGNETLNTTKAMREMFNNLLSLGKVFLKHTGITDVLRDVMARTNKAFSAWAERIHEFMKSEEFKEWAEGLKPTLVNVGATLLKVGTIVSGVGAALGTAVTALTTLKGAKKGLTSVFGLITKDGSKAKGILGGIGKIGGKLGAKLAGAASGVSVAIGAVQGVRTAVLDMGEVMGDPAATGIDKFEALTKGGVKGVAKFIDSLLMGIPGMVLNKFFPGLEDSFDSGVTGLFDKLRTWFGDFDAGSTLSVVLDKIRIWLDGAADTFADKAPEWMAQFGKALGQAIGGLNKLMVDTISGFWSSVWSMAFSDSEDTIETDGRKSITESLLSVLQTVGDSILAFFKGIADGILNAYGTNLEIVGVKIEIFWEKLKAGANAAWMAVKGAGQDFIGWIGSKFIGGIENILLSFETIYTFGKKAIVAISEAWKGNWSGVKVFFLDVMDSMIGALAEGVKGITGTLKDWMEMVPKSIRPDFYQGIIDGIDSVDDSVDSARGKLSGMIADTKKEADESAGVFKKLDAESMARRAQITGQAAIYKSALTSMGKQTREQAETEAKASDDRIKALEGEEQAMRDKFALEQANARQSRDLAKQGKKSLEETLATFAKEGEDKKYSRAQLEAGSAAIKGYLDETMRSITDRVRSGEMKIGEAQIAAEKARTTALQRAREAATKAGEQKVAAKEAAKRAKGEKPVMGAAAARTMITGKFGKDLQVVNVEFKGGGWMERELGRRSAVTLQSATGGRQ